MANSNSDRPTSGHLGEFALIAELFAPLARNAPGAFGLLDDAATIAPPAGHELVVTTDALVEGVHFLPGDPPDQIAKKALRVNLSDLAAKGATPLGYLMALMLPETAAMTWLRQFAHGLGEDQEEFGLSLLGGDTTATPGPLSVAITAMGFVPAGKMIRRAGAAVGDSVFVSGTVGDAGAGLACLKGEAAPDALLIARYRLPTPRLKLGRALRGIASAGLDVSDGLLADLGHIADVSRVRIAVVARAVPRSAAFTALCGDNTQAVIRAATAGDDYELAFTTPAERKADVQAAARAAGVAISEIGWVEARSGLALLDERGEEIPVSRRGFTHF